MKKVKAKGTLGDWVVDLKGEKPTENWSKKFMANVEPTQNGAGWEVNLKLVRYKNKSPLRWRLEGVPKKKHEADVICIMLCQMAQMLDEYAEQQQKSKT